MADRARRWLTACAVVTAFVGGVGPARAGEGPTLGLTVDARDLPRHLVHSRIEVPCRPGKLALWYPKWIPGTHSPCGPVQNVAGLLIETPDGKPVAWRRDETDVYRIECDVPPGVGSVVVRLDVICDKPATEAAGYLSYGNESVAIINWATSLLYPEGPAADEIRVDASLTLPPRWDCACSLDVERTTDSMGAAAGGMRGGGKSVAFRRVSLTELIDDPAIAGEHLRRIPLETGPYPPAFLDLASESPSALQVGSEVIGIYSRVVREAGALFGTCHYPSFHFLVTCSDDLGYLGLEHLSCSINGVRERDLLDRGRLRGWVGMLLPHEYVHSWCGKFRRPAGMCTSDFHTPQKTRLLWVYEGLASYLDGVLMVRSGMIDLAEYRRTLAWTIGSLMRREGRRWRSLEDTAVASHLLRGGSPDWRELRREQDYYAEGSLIWLEADAIIREKTRGRRSLDDFCRRFLGLAPTDARVVPYELADVVKALNEVCEFDWERYLRDRTEKPLEALPLEVVGRCGYRIGYTTQAPSAASRIARGGGGGVSARDSLGLSFDGEGKVTDVVPGMIGDKAGLGPGTKVIGVNGKVFSSQRLLDALAESVKLRKIGLLIVEGDHFRTIELDYADGPRYLELVRDRSKPDLLAEIFKPIAAATSPPKPAGAVALPPAPKGYVCYRASRPIQIDGRLDDGDWESAPWTDEFVDIEGDARPRPRFRTRAKMLWDDTYFYVGALLEEPHVWGTLTKHDSIIFQDNDFEIFIDPDGDNHEYYEIELNALNTEWDLFLRRPYRDGGPALNEWEIPGLKTAVHVDGTINRPTDRDASWSVEFAIPWKVLGEFARRPAPPCAGDQWRVNFSRVEWQHELVDGGYRKVPHSREDNWVWSPQGVIDMHRPERWGFVQFSTAPPGQAVYDVDPAGPIRDRLMQVYHAQTAFHKQTKRWATSLDELKLPEPLGVPSHRVELRTTPDGYVAALTLTSPGGPPQIWTVQQDSRIRQEPPPRR
jgi:predicted metalloprotease with PDZ domain